MATKISTNAIVLKDFDFSESSKIISAYSEDLGKISIMAKSAKNSSSNLLAATTVLFNVNYILSRGKNYYYIVDYSIINSNIELTFDYERLIYAMHFVELVEKTVPKGAGNKFIYRLLSAALERLKSTNNPLELNLAFELKYLSFMGYRPNLNEEYEYFSIREGSVKNCDAYSKKIEKKDIIYLKKLLSKKFLEEQSNFKDPYLQKLLLEYIKFNMDVKSFNSIKLI